MTLPFHQ